MAKNLKVRPRPMKLAADTRLEDFPLGYHLVTLTPELAAFWLDEYNNNNRTIQRSKVSKLATQMLICRWEDYHPHGISFLYDPETGKLFMSDGQHRLAACVEALVDIHIWVYIDVPSTKAVRAVLDKGRLRSTADNLGRDNHGTAVFKRVLFGLGDPPKGWTDHDYRKMDMRFGWAVDFVLDHEPNVRGSAGLRDSRVMGTIALALLYGADEERILTFLTILQTGQYGGLPENNIANELRNYLMVDIGRMLGEKGGHKQKVHTLAWYRAQSSVDKFLREVPQKRLSTVEKNFFPALNPKLDLNTLEIDVAEDLVEKTLGEKNTLV